MLEAQTGIVQHIEKFKAQGHRVFQHPSHLAGRSAPGTFVPPTLIELDQLAAASRALELARKVRMPLQEIWPLMAQIAWLRRDLDGVRKYMSRLPDNAALPHGMRGVASFWRQRQVAAVDLHV